MKAKTQIVAILTVLFLLLFSPQFTAAIPEVREFRSNSLTSNSVIYIDRESLDYEVVLIDGIWWILVYDGGKLIDAYPE